MMKNNLSPFPKKNSWKVSTPNFPGFYIMAKPYGPICNLGCRYCYYLKKAALYPNSQFRMSKEVLEIYTRQYIKAQRVPEIFFSWQGGEPTLIGIDFFENAIAFQKKYRKPGQKIHNVLQTNGTTLNDDWCHFFKKNNFFIGLSLDGPRSMHDIYRVDRTGQPTFNQVMKGLKLLQRHQIEFNILTTIHKANVDYPLEVYRFLRDEIGARHIQFIPIVEKDEPNNFQKESQATNFSVTGKKYGQYLINIFDEWVSTDVGQVFVQLFDVALGVWLGQPASLCTFSNTCGTSPILEHNGDLYSCDHYVYQKYRLGNIKEKDLFGLMMSHEQISFGLAKRNKLPLYCRECEVSFICNGGCPKNRISRTPNGERGLNYLCEGYKTFFSYISPYMKKMTELIRKKQPPAKIMQL